MFSLRNPKIFNNFKHFLSVQISFYVLFCLKLFFFSFFCTLHTYLSILPVISPSAPLLPQSSHMFQSYFYKIQEVFFIVTPMKSPVKLKVKSLPSSLTLSFTSNLPFLHPIFIYTRSVSVFNSKRCKDKRRRPRLRMQRSAAVEDRAREELWLRIWC